MNFVDKLLIWLTSENIGQDQYGNSYFMSRKSDYLGRRKRYVIYHGIVDPTKIPPLWHAWLYHLTNEIPLQGKENNYNWQQGFVPNLTGTSVAYQPPGVDGQRDHVYADYIAWKP